MLIHAVAEIPEKLLEDKEIKRNKERVSKKEMKKANQKRNKESDSKKETKEGQ